MNRYRDYTIKLTLKSPIITSFQSDTLFGHICWAINYLKWDDERRIEDFLALYDQGKLPLLISNGFPKDYLPKPIVRPILQKELRSIFGEKNRKENSYKIKTIKKAELIPKSDLLQIIKGQISPGILFQKLAENFKREEKNREERKKEVVHHNTINRITNRVTTGLYEQEEVFYSEDFNEFEIYLKTYYFNKDDLKRIFEFISMGGFGKDKSTGKGRFDFSIIEGTGLEGFDNRNGFMTLSSYIPHSGAPTKGYYEILLKYGKLGGSFAGGSTEVHNNPFKKPLIMFRAGSTFYDQGYDESKIYGSLLPDVHKNPKIRHYGYAFPLGINMEEENDE